MMNRNMMVMGLLWFGISAGLSRAESGLEAAGFADVKIERVPHRLCDPSQANACEPGSFCRVPAGRCDDAVVRGVCVRVPDVCSAEVAPVCGCDGQTYANRCEAARARASIAHAGRCRRSCTRDDAEACEAGQYCKFPPGTCDEQDVHGHCEAIPQACPDIYRPVCGCDGLTYGNRCEAASAGASVAYRGPCREACNRANPEVCEDAEYCHFPPGTCDSADVQGQCVPVPLGCPDVWDPVCGCDGQTYGNRCDAAMAEVSIAHHGECRRACDRASSECGDGEYCHFPPGTCDSADVVGTCHAIPNGCPTVYEPVCGCDGVTYGNRCEAAKAGVSVAHGGECPQICDGIAGLPCDEGEFCLHRPNQCEVSDVAGVCVSIPRECPRINEPVCGCDGSTYANRCLALRAGVQIDHEGPCIQVCGGIAGLPCDEGEFCRMRMGQCDFADAQGVCIPVPRECPAIAIPVCGCDGVTYRNECQAVRAGMQVDHLGRCRQ